MIYSRHISAELPYVAGSECSGLDFYNTIGVQFYIIKQQINELLRVTDFQTIFFPDIGKAGTKFEKKTGYI